MPQADGTPSDGPVQTAMRPLGEIFLESAKHGWRDLPGLLARAFGLVWAAGRSEFLLTSALQFVSALGITAQLFMTKVVFGAILAGGNASGGAFTSILPKVAAFAALGMVLDMLNALRSEQSRVLGELVARYAFDQILDIATRVDLLSYESADFHDRLRRAQASGPLCAMQIGTGSIGFFGDIISALGIILGLLALQPLLLPLVLIGYVPLWIVGRLNTRDLYTYHFGMTRNDRMRAYLQRLMMDRSPAKELRSFNLGPILRERLDRLYQESIAKLRLLARRRTGRTVVGALSQSTLTALAIGGIAYLFVTGHMDLASTGAAVFGLYQLSSRLGAIHSSVTSLYESVLFIQDYDLLLALRPSLAAAPRAAAPRSFSLLQVDDVRFTYPGAAAPAIAGVSIELRAGEIIALVGENGSGKTTLAKVLAGLYEPSHGSVRWDGVDVATVDRDDLRRSISVVFQDFERYLLTARENVGFGRVERVADSAAVVAAARRADAYDFIQSLPDGLETMLGREWMGGYDLSVGQWQRVALARAFFRDAPFVILDEPTAALDPRAESELFERMRELLEGRSVVLVSHRFSSVRSADRIYVLQRGKVTEHGTHAELMELNGHYADLFRLQANAYLK